MNSQTGVFVFLVTPAQRGELTEEDIEKAIEIAGSKSPSGSKQLATIHATLRGLGQWKALNYFKGVRWLAIIRRDEGDAAFQEKVAELRESFK